MVQDPGPAGRTQMTKPPGDGLYWSKMVRFRPSKISRSCGWLTGPNFISPKPPRTPTIPITISPRRTPLRLFVTRLTVNFPPVAIHPDDKAMETGDLVKCLATRFDNESEDFQGRKFSERHSLEGHGAYVHGVVKRVLRNRTVKVLYDGDTRQYASDPSHLLPAEDEDSSSDSGESSNASEEERTPDDAAEGEPESGEEGPVGQDGTPDANTDDEDEAGAESDDDEGEGHCAVGSSVEVGGQTWKRVQTMGDCSRGAKARKKFTLKNFTFTSETTKKEVL